MSCAHCERRFDALPREATAHEFFINQVDNFSPASIVYSDSERGWEGEEIAYCPWCGEKLTSGTGNNVGTKENKVTKDLRSIVEKAWELSSEMYLLDQMLEATRADTIEKDVVAAAFEVIEEDAGKIFEHLKTYQNELEAAGNDA